MNKIILSGQLRNIEYSHQIEDIVFNKALLIVPKENGQEDVINLKFKAFSNPYKENDRINIEGNIRSYSYKIDENKNKVIIYVFTYFDKPENEEIINHVELDGRICKINDLRVTQSGKHNVHFILANNLISSDNSKRLNSYIPCIAWGNLAKELSKLTVNTKLKVIGALHSREHKKILDNGEVELRVAHELVIDHFEVIE